MPVPKKKDAIKNVGSSAFPVLSKRGKHERNSLTARRNAS
jgi:hypothetical protein